LAVSARPPKPVPPAAKPRPVAAHRGPFNILINHVIFNAEDIMKKLISSGVVILSAFMCTSAMAAPMTVTGTLEDSFCFVTMGAHGPGHKACATNCAKKGIPVALVEKGTDKMYILLPPKNDSSLPGDVISRMEDEVTVTGNEYQKGGITYLTADSVK
jgi:hypothetical protein